MMKYVIVVAGGSGSRMNSETPKQFLLLNGKPVLMHSIQAFHNFDNSINIIVVLPSLYMEEWKSLCVKHNFNIVHSICEGGHTRFHSVKSGLALVENKSIVAVHDAARPLTNRTTIQKAFDTAIKHGSAIPVVPVSDSLRRVEMDRNQAVNRADYVAVQTPQCFDSELLISCYESPFQLHFTDDASVVEYCGNAIYMSEGSPYNIKVTHPADIIIAEAIINKISGY